MRHLRFPVAATRVGMVAEQVVRAFWPFWTVIFLILAPLMMGWQDDLPLEVFWGSAVVSAIAFLATLIWGARRFRVPSRAAALERVDAAMPGRPIAAIADTQAIGSGDAASEAVWQAHVARMAARTKGARVVEPDLRVSDKDPYGLRFIALLFFVAALMFGSFFRVTSVGEIVAGGEQALATGPVWEGWVEPPAYTGKPSIYLNDVPAGPLRVPEGSQVTLRLYGEVGALTVAETISGRMGEVGAASDAQQQFEITQSGTLTIGGGEAETTWNITAVEDVAPEVDLTGPIEADAMGELSQPFSAFDDYGVEFGTATFMLDLTAVDRTHGLTIDPDPIEPLVLDLPMPFTGDRSDFEEFLIDNLSRHPLANMPVTLQLEVIDAAEQKGTTPAEPMILPGRRFFQPFAKAVIEQRRDLMWSKANARRVNQILRAVSHRPEGLFSNETSYLRLRTIIRRLDNFSDVGLTDEVQAEIVEALWDLAVQLEDGRLADARERLRRAQERLAEAMRDGASDEEIAELMQELREATDDYLRMLAEEAEPSDGTDQADSGQQGEQLGMDELQALMDRIEELMQEGRMAEAQELMEQLNQMMENLRVTQGEGGDGPQTPGEQSMQDLAETLRDQEELSDDSFSDLQDQFNPGQSDQQQPGQQGQQPGQPGQQGQQGQQPGQQQGQSGQGADDPSQGGRQGDGQGVGENSRSGEQRGDGAGGEGDQRSLADRQQALREELQRQRDGLPNLDGESGEIARRSLERAEGAMDGAEEALRDGDLAEAIDRQAEAMDALRNGMRELGQALAENQNAEPGQGSEQGEASGRPTPGQRDPLGREMGNTGQMGTDQELLGREDINRRAEELLDEIRRRSAQQSRPEVERDYLRRLLDQF